ncbi:murein biosynthesis integral membrane protein MurJ [Allostreptomyces psammosilenae]|uniref:Putative peptidoglycan lipid II flippase n=1 Tax=Allostreptomyces psammosilenae TaxID=1892865 RepID=A0A852ZXK8_9ACTN|nr:lipid II flippase MurJ [Allostreptomyces psammosilenae]NYI03371.1 putative peptidoglycan lipid II flippase [Allostreptomyces psammosilenae]
MTAAATARRVGTGLAGAALLMGVVTVFARLAGFLRQLVFNGTVGETNLGQVYSATNAVPNIVFEVVAGGALASVVVPLLAAPIARGVTDARARAEAGAIASALLTWSVTLLVPAAALACLAAGPIARFLLGDGGTDGGSGTATVPGAHELAVRMLLVFLPQIPLYGLAVVSGGILQAHGRFLPSSLAPLISSLGMAVAYSAYAATAGDATGDDLRALGRDAELVLTLGTTGGVLALALCTLLPLRSTGLRLRPTLRFPAGTAARAGRLAIAGVATLGAQQLAMLTVVKLSAQGTTGALVTYQNTWMVYLLPYAVLAVPIATSAFPRLSAHGAEGDTDAFARLAATTTRAVLLVGFAGAGLLAATALPVARVFDAAGAGDVGWQVMARALVAFAPGLVGYALIAHLGRALGALGRPGPAAVATVLGWAAVVAADLALVRVVPREWLVAALGLGNTVGMTVAGALLLRAVAVHSGRAALTGVVRAGAAGGLGAVCGGAAGWAVAAGAQRLLPGADGILTPLAVGLLAALVALAVCAAVALPLAGDQVRSALAGRAGLGRLGRLARPTRPGGGN